MANTLQVLLAAGLFALVAQTAAAQQDITLQAGADYTHPHSGIRVPAVLAGQMRTAAGSYAEDMLDVGLNFDDETSVEALSIYVYRRTNGSVPLWFAQAQSVIEHRSSYADPELVAPPANFVPPGTTAASGLRAIYRTGAESGRISTGLALFAHGDWYVKLRATSATRSPEDLGRWMDEALAQLQVPQPPVAERAVAPIADCQALLRFRREARDAPGEAADLVVDGMMSGLFAGAITAQVRERPPVVWCRDAVLAPDRIVYRPDNADDSYLLALGDNGQAVLVGQELRIEGISPRRRAGPRYTVRFMTAARDINFVSQDRLPSPARVIELIETNRAMSTRTTWGEDSGSVTVHVEALAD